MELRKHDQQEDLLSGVPNDGISVLHKLLMTGIYGIQRGRILRSYPGWGIRDRGVSKLLLHYPRGLAKNVIPLIQALHFHYDALLGTRDHKVA